jgi:hypothetical protein
MQDMAPLVLSGDRVCDEAASASSVPKQSNFDTSAQSVPTAACKGILARLSGQTSRCGSTTQPAATAMRQAGKVCTRRAGIGGGIGNRERKADLNMRNKASRSLKALLAAIAVTASTHALAQANGSLGTRIIKGYWIEGGAFLAVKPTTPFDNPTGCTQSDFAILPATNPAYKPMLAAVMHAMVTNTPLSIWGVGCYTAWGGQTWPTVHALGPAW